LELLKVLAMPFQLASLLFVAITSGLLGLLLSLGGATMVTLVVSAHAGWLMLVWLTNYALQMIDDAANGHREARTASIEMMHNPFLDARCWLHPGIAAALAITHYLRPEWPVWPALVAAAALFPASIGACAMSGLARDALNPVAVFNVVRGLGPWYLLLVLFVSGCALVGVLLVRHLQPGMVLFASGQLLVLLVYAAIGGAMYQRRLELGFEPIVSPERKADVEDAERVERRQQFIDGVYKDLRVREAKRATANVTDWLRNAPQRAVSGDVQAILVAGRGWNLPPREYPRFLRDLLPTLLALRQPAAAWSLVEAGLAAAPEFAPADEPTAVAIIQYALQSGRRRAAAQLLENFLKREGAAPAGPELSALRVKLQPEG
jgi:hypothetical protein